MTTTNPDRIILLNCHQHSDTECDAAAARLARSKEWTDRDLGQHWIRAQGRA